MSYGGGSTSTPATMRIRTRSARTPTSTCPSSPSLPTRPPAGARAAAAAGLADGAPGRVLLPDSAARGTVASRVERAAGFLQRASSARPVEISFLILRLIAYVLLVFLVLSPGIAFAFLGVQLGLFGVYMGMSFAPNHKGMPLVPAEAKLDFLRRQVLMSRNIRGSRMLDTVMGGLNYQIEHHLFPSMPRPHLRAASRNDRAILPRARCDIHADRTVAVLWHRDPVHQPRRARRTRPVRMPAAPAASGGLAGALRPDRTGLAACDIRPCDGLPARA